MATEQTGGVWQDDGTGTNILWNAGSVGKFVTSWDPKINNLADVITVSSQRHGDRPCVGHRVLVERYFEEVKGKKFEKLTLEDKFTWTNYKDFNQRADHFGSGLVAWSGLKPTDRMIIYAETQSNWIMAAFGAWKNNLQVVTAYATLGADGAAFAINSTKCSVVVADAKLLKILLTVQPQCPCIKYIVTITEADEETKKNLEAAGIKVTTVDELVKAGAEKPVEQVVPKGEDTALIMFTSGTTGNPKGVVLSHSNIISAVAGCKGWFDDAGINSTDVYCAYLPLAHIMEILAEIAVFSVGTSVGFASPHTLTATGVKLGKNCQGDFAILQPTFLAFAPAVLEKIYNSIMMKTSSLTGLKKLLFDWGTASGEANFDKGVVGSSWLYNAALFKKIQALVGGKLKAALTGSAPLDSGVHKFIQTALCIPIRQGYGTTETCAGSCIQAVNMNRVGSVGTPLPSCCLKLRDWEEGNYRRTDVTNPSIGKERGEIVLGGPAITLGYLVDPENPDQSIIDKNNDDFEVDKNGIRWFFTGDIGEVTKDGNVSIIDRKKDLVKLQMGEYVALSKVEGQVKTCTLVENALVHADPAQSYCTVLVCPFLPAVQQLADQNKWGDDMEEIASKPELAKAIVAQIKSTCGPRLAKFEVPTKVYVVPPSRLWTPENDLLTAAMKLKRKPIHNAFKDEIATLYA